MIFFKKNTVPEHLHKELSWLPKTAFPVECHMCRDAKLFFYEDRCEAPNINVALSHWKLQGGPKSKQNYIKAQNFCTEDPKESLEKRSGL
jgi:hypothetical protein